MPKDTIGDRRLDALETYRLACDDPAGADWRAIADMLAGLMPTPRKPAEPAGLEWESYPPSLHKQRGRHFRPSRGAEFLFADGVVVHAPLLHHHKRDKPDWSRSARVAVHFYRARIAPGCRVEVPAIECAFDPLRGVEGDAATASVETAELREGVALVQQIAAE